MKPINREILSLAVPSIVTNITTPLLALMDVVIVGHMGSPVYIAAIAVGGTMFNMIYWLFAFLRMGTSGMTAQAHGASDDLATSMTLFRGLFVATVASAIIIIFQTLIFKGAITLLEVRGSVRDLAESYFDILVWGTPASLSTFVMTGWLLGMKNARAPMWISFIINITNIIISLLLVLILKMKVEGVATGTLVAQWSGFIIGAAIVIRRYHPTFPGVTALADSKSLKRFFAVNSDIFLRTLCLIAVTMWFTRSGSIQGTVMLAVNTLLMQFFIMFSYFMDGFAFAGESLCGNLIGRRDKNGLRDCISNLFGWSVLMVVIFTSAYALLGEEIMSLISDSGDVIESSMKYFYWALAIPAAGFAAFTWDGIFIGATRTREMLLSMLISTTLFFIVYNLAFQTIGNHGLWLAFTTYLFSRGLILTLCRGRLYKGLS